MNGAIRLLFVFGSTLVLSAVASAQTTEHRKCTLAILNGTYGLLHDGIVFGEEGIWPK